LGYDASGKQIRKRWTVDYPLTPGGKDMAPDKALQWAQEQAAEMEKKLISGDAVDSGKLKLSDLFEQWDAQHISLNLAPKTASDYRKLWKRVEPALGHIHLDKLRPTHIQQLYTQLQQDGANLKTGGKLDVGHIHSVLSSMFGFAVKLQLLRDNPCQRVQKPKTYKKPKIALTLEQAHLFLSRLDNEPLELQCLFGIALCCGLRKSELVGLRWTDIDVNGVLWVSRSISYVAGMPLIEKTTKTGIVRPVRLASFLLPILAAYREEQDERKSALGDLFTDKGFMFAQDNGEARHPDSVPKRFKRYLRRCGFDDDTIAAIHVHSLRDTFATLLLASGVDVRTTAGLMGHSQPTLTLNVYGQYLQSQNGAAATMFDSMIPTNALINA
jgi:integrase